MPLQFTEDDFATPKPIDEPASRFDALNAVDAGDVLSRATDRVVGWGESALRAVGKGIETVEDMPAMAHNAFAQMTGGSVPGFRGPWERPSEAIPKMVKSGATAAARALLVPAPGMEPERKGISEAVGDTASSFSTGEGIATLPLFETKVGRAAMLGLQAIKAPDEISKTVATLNDPNASREDKWKAVTGSTINLAMMAALSLHISESEVRTKFDPADAAKVVEQTQRGKTGPGPVAKFEPVETPPEQPIVPPDALTPKPEKVVPSPPETPVPAPNTSEIPPKPEESAPQPIVDQPVNNPVEIPQSEPTAVTAQPELPSQPAKPFKASKGERPWDIIDDISANGKIRLKSAGEVFNSKSAEAEFYNHEDYKDISTGHGREAFDPNGREPDQVVSDLIRAGKMREGSTAVDLRDALKQAKADREAFGKGDSADAFQEQISKPGKKKDALNADGLKQTETFNLDGQEVEVSHIDQEDGSIQVKSEKYGTQDIPAGATIHVDKGSYKKLEDSTDFLPEENPSAKLPILKPGQKQGDLMVNQTEDFALAGENGKDFERAQAEKAKAEQTKREAEALAKKQQLDLLAPKTAAAIETVKPKAGDALRKLADKIKPKGGDLGTFGLIPETLHRLLNDVADAVDRGEELAAAITEAAKKIKGAWDESEFRAWAARAMNGEQVEMPPDRTPNSGRIVNDEGEKLTATYKAQVDAERKAQGLPPLPESQRRSWEEADSEAMRRRMDPDYTPNLIAEINEKPRNVTDAERMALLRQRNVWDQQFDSLVNDQLAAQEAGDLGAEKKAMDARTELAAKQDALDKALQASGREWGRTGMAMQAMMKEDFSLSRMMAVRRANRAEQNLPPEVEKQTVDLRKSIVEMQDRFDKIMAEEQAKYQKLDDQYARVHAENEMNRALAQAMAREATKAKLAAQYPQPELPGTPKAESKPKTRAAKVLESLSSAADAARARMKERLKRANTFTAQAGDLVDVAIIGADHLAKGTKNFIEWGNKMVGELGDWVKPHLETVWSESKQRIRDEEAKDQAGERDLPGEQKAILEGIRESQSEEGGQDNHDLARYVRKLAENLIEGGVRKIDPLLDALYPMLQEVLPDITRREVSDAFSGYGDYQPPNMDPIQVIRGDLRAMGQARSKLEDIQAKKPLERSGPQRRPQSADVRRENQKVSEAKKKYGVVVTDPAAQLRSALDTIKTRQRNRIADLRFENKTRERIVRTKTEVDTSSDEEWKANAAEIEKLKKEHQEIFGDRQLTDEERLKRALSAAERGEAKANAELEAAKRGEFPKDESKPLPASDKLDAVKARTNAARAQTRELRGLDEHFQREQEAKKLERDKAALEKDIADKQEQVKTGDVATNKGEVNRPSRPELEPLKQERDKLNKQISELRKKPDAQRQADAVLRRLVQIEKAIKEGEAKIASGDVSATGAKVNRPMIPPLEEAKQQLDAVNKRINELRNPKPTPHQINERQNAALESRLTKAADDYYNRRIRWDFGPKPKAPPFARSEAVNRAQAQVERAKQKWQQAKEKDLRGRRNWFQKFTASLNNLNRLNILTNVSVIEHLTGAAVENVVSRPARTAVAQLMRFSKELNAIREKAAYHGGISAASEIANLRGIVGSSRALWQKLREGKSDIDWIHSNKSYPKEFGAMVQNIHGAIKEPVRQGIYSLSLKLRLEAAEAKGLKPGTDEVLQKALSKEAFDDANADIFMGDNFLTKALHNNAIGYLKGLKMDPGLAKLTADVLEIIFPIVNVSTNIAIRKWRLSYGLPEAVTRYGVAKYRGELANGAEKLTPRDAELITKSFAYGGIGLALGVYAWLNSDQFGGIWVPGKQAPHNKSGDVKPGDIATPWGWNVSHHLLHGPLGGHMNMVADARRLYDRVNAQTDNPWEAASEATFFSLYAGLRDLPAFSTPARLASPFKSAGQKAGEFVKNMLIAGVVQNVADSFSADKPKAKTFTQEIRSGVPGGGYKK